MGVIERPPNNYACERYVQNAIVNSVKNMGGIVEKVHGNAYQTGRADLNAMVKGNYYRIEVKDIGKVPTQLQLANLREWAAKGAICFWTDTPSEAQFAFDYHNHSLYDNKKCWSHCPLRSHHPSRCMTYEALRDGRIV